jgi:alpha-glucosidase
VTPQSAQTTPATTQPWWREAVFYQVYPRSFGDTTGDGVGDLAGITARLDHVASLGVDALWLSPFYPSPQVDAGYDVADYCDVDPMFGTLDDLDTLVAAAHARDLRVTIDLVPNHCSDQHPWFQAALAAGPGSPERELFHFVDGRGERGELPPNNWRSAFGGPSWTRVTEPDGTPSQWYYHLFAPEQPDFNWGRPEVLAEFERILRFWLDRGIDGFRIDVSDALIKDTAWEDTPDGNPLIPKDDASGVHEIYRAFRAVMDSYDGDRMAVIETGAPDDVVALFLRPDEMHLAFNFRFVKAGWDAAAIRAAVDDSLAAYGAVGAPTTWVTDNHDTTRSVTRYGADVRLEGEYVPGSTAELPLDDAALARGTRRARAMAVLLLGLPGAAYVYAGQELGLPEVVDLPAEVLQDPIVARSGGTSRGRDGCRVPLPWAGSRPPFGFAPDGTTTWLPQPEDWASLTAESQADDDASMLALYRALGTLRRAEPALRGGDVEWLEQTATRLVLRRTPAAGVGGRALTLVVNLGEEAAPLPDGELLLATAPLVGGMLAGESAGVLA